jgi:uncharacterized membrane protein
MSSDTADQGVAGVGMFLANYTGENDAGEAFDALKQAKDYGLFYYDDAAVVSRDAGGKVNITEHGDMSTGKGAGIGALIGGVIGILGGPAGVAVGAGAGAAIGGIAAHSDAGFNNETLEKIGGALPNSTSALAVTTSKDFVESVRSQATEEDALTMAQDIADEISDNLKAGQDVLMALVLTEDGVAATKVVATDDAVAVFGMAATDDGVVAGAVVATDDGVAATKVVATDDGVAAGAVVATDDGVAAAGAAAVPIADDSDSEADDQT